ncbi:MAG: glutamate--tRNA ligase family protein [Bdellovibrionales bacterium]
MTLTRFAPSPTGYLHLGHAYSALFAFETAKRKDGKFLLRIEDIDPTRCKPEFTEAIFEDLRWLGLSWEEPVRKQSEHMADYAQALAKLHSLGVLYPCACTRADIAREVKESAHAPHLPPHGPDGPIYPGTCRKKVSALEKSELSIWQAQRKAPRPPQEGEGFGVRVESGFKRQTRPLTPTLSPSRGQGSHATLTEPANAISANWRLDIAKALQLTGPLFWHDRDKGRIEAHPEDFGDVVLARKDVPTSYHLSVTVDDHLQGITLVTRGEDLFRATDIHRLLQALLGYETPDYRHHPLLKDASGKRFAKRDKALALRDLRANGATPEQMRQSVLSPPP